MSGILERGDRKNQALAEADNRLPAPTGRCWLAAFGFVLIGNLFGQVGQQLPGGTLGLVFFVAVALVSCIGVAVAAKAARAGTTGASIVRRNGRRSPGPT